MPNLIPKLSTKCEITGHYLVSVGEISIMNKQEYSKQEEFLLCYSLDRIYAKKAFVR